VTAVADSARTPETAPRATGSPVVVKIGGRSLEAPGAHEQLAAEVARLSGDRLLVHGGGAEVSAWCERLGLAPRFAEGLRVTDAETLEVAAAVLAGLANKRLVARLRAAGLDAVGLAALDAGIVEVAPHEDAARLGQVGAVVATRRTPVDALLAQGLLPVVASIGQHQGTLLNLNADDVACALAAALGASDLVLLSDAPGLILGGALQPGLDAAGIEAALASPQVTAGMRPKLRAAHTALLAGVRRVHIATWRGEGTLARVLAGSAGGTTITHAEEADG
jgi:acetylglutamate kinase